MGKWDAKYSISTGRSFYPENGLLIKKAGYTSYHLGECCVRAVESSRNYSFCPTCNLSQQVARQMINRGVNFLNAKIVAVDGVKVKNAESFGAELLDYPHSMSDRQKYRIRKLGGRIDKSMSRSQASQYIKSLMRIDPLHAESTDCSACQGWGWNEELNMVCEADGCIGGWIVPKKPTLLERGLELGVGMGMGMAGIAIMFGLLGGTVGFAAEELKKRRD